MAHSGYLSSVRLIPSPEHSKIAHTHANPEQRRSRTTTCTAFLDHVPPPLPQHQYRCPRKSRSSVDMTFDTAVSCHTPRCYQQSHSNTSSRAIGKGCPQISSQVLTANTCVSFQNSGEVEAGWPAILAFWTRWSSLGIGRTSLTDPPVALLPKSEGWEAG